MLVVTLTACAKKHEDNKLGRNTMCLQVHKLSDTLYQFNESADFAGNGQFQPYVDAYLLIGKKRADRISGRYSGNTRASGSCGRFYSGICRGRL